MTRRALLVAAGRLSPCSVAALVLAGAVAAQTPLAPEHAMLKEMAGNWSVTSSLATALGASASPQLETSELVCGGLWLESVTRAGNSEMFWLTGFDPTQKRFVRLRVAGREDPVLEDGEFDAAQRTITWRGQSDVAKRLGYRVVVALPTDAPRVERTFARASAKDHPMAERVFHRAKEGERALPKREQPKAPLPEHELFAQLAGEWECALTTTIPGFDKAMRSTGRMREEVVGDGCWLRSSFEGDFSGSKIEGRGLMGFDQKQKRYVRYWVDSGSAVFAISTSALDEGGKKMIGSGVTQMPGGEVTIAEEVELGADLRRVVQRLRTSEGKDGGTFEMVMTRRPPAKDK
ncbi:MAG TPA: DUF1579 family protein [Planctomycetota bacterium]